jgi:trk system potassium uptake protein TrkH
MIGPDKKLTSTPLTLAGVALMLVAGGQVVSLGVEIVMGGDESLALAASAAVTAALGFVFWSLFTVQRDLRPASVFTAVAAAWLAASLAGGLPYVLSGLTPNIDDAIFESVSGFSCTGSTILSAEQFEAGSPGIMFWRQMTQWFGGMGMIVLAVAVLPFLGVGGLELVRAEAPGPTTDRLAPRVSETAKRLWIVYLGFTVLAMIALLAVGLSLYDAVAHAFTIVSTGGFSPYAESIGFYDSVLVEGVVMVGMVIGAMNFALHWRLLREGVRPYRESTELRTFLGILVFVIVAVTAILVADGVATDSALRNSAFNVTTLLTSTGFGNASAANPLGNFVIWAAAAQVLLLGPMVIGGMTGSTSGGMKVLRASVLVRGSVREIKRARRPRARLLVKEGGTPIPDQIVENIAGFGMLYFLFIVAGMLAVAVLGSDLVTSASTAVSAMGNMGPGLGEAGPTSNFLVFTRPARMVLALLMLVGRLEIFPIMLTFVVIGRRVRRISRAVSVG